MAISRSEQFR